MKSYSFRTTIVVLAVALYVSTAAYAQPHGRERDQRFEQVVRIIKQIQKLLGGVSTNDDIPTPPIPK
jgi:cytochrome c556